MPDELRVAGRLRPRRRRRARLPRGPHAGRRRAAASTACTWSACGAGGPRRVRRRSSARCSPTTATPAAGSTCCRRARRRTTPRTDRPVTPASTTRTRPSTLSGRGRCHCTRQTGATAATVSGSPSCSASTPQSSTASRRAHGVDQRDARAMQSALWPATIGYLLGTHDGAACSPTTTVEQARWFFTASRERPRRRCRRSGSVASRTAIRRRPRSPAASVVPPAAADATSRPGRRSCPGSTRCSPSPTPTGTRWSRPCPRSDAAAATARDAHQTLLGVLGLHASSVEFHYRYAESIEQLVQPTAGLSGFGDDPLAGAPPGRARRPGARAARSLRVRRRRASGRAGPVLPRRPGPSSQGPLVDDRPLSETEPVRVWTTGERNYLQLAARRCATLARRAAPADRLRRQGPDALLFLLAPPRADPRLRRRRIARASTTSRATRRRCCDPLRQEPAFVHVAADGAEREPVRVAVQLGPAHLPGRPIGRSRRRSPTCCAPRSATRVLRDQVEALEAARRRLDGAAGAGARRARRHGAPTGSTRGGSVSSTCQLEVMRGIPQDDAPQDDGRRRRTRRRRSVTTMPMTRRRRVAGTLGAYGWLEDVRPEPPQPGARRAARRPGGDLRPTDHRWYATAATAVTFMRRRSTRRSRPRCSAAATSPTRRPPTPSAMAVNLSSERVRKAIDVLEGMRNGQSLAELLGYRLERGLHDASGFAEVDEFIFDLRKAFPLALGPVAIDEAARGRRDRGDRGPQRRRRPAARRARRAHRATHLPVRPPPNAAGDGHARPARRDRRARSTGLLDVHDAVG